MDQNRLTQIYREAKVLKTVTLSGVELKEILEKLAAYKLLAESEQEELDDLKDQVELLENQINSRISAHLSRAFRDKFRDN